MLAYNLWYFGFFLMGIGVVFGIVYPIVMVVLYKICGSKLTIKEILKRI